MTLGNKYLQLKINGLTQHDTLQVQDEILLFFCCYLFICFLFSVLLYYVWLLIFVSNLVLLLGEVARKEGRYEGTEGHVGRCEILKESIKV